MTLADKRVTDPVVRPDRFRSDPIAAIAEIRTSLSLILLGVLILVGGIWRHFQFAGELRHLRGLLVSEELGHGESAYPVSLTPVAAILLLVTGVAAAASIVFDIHPFG